MTSYLIDVNVWLALSWGGHLHSAAATLWLAGLPKSATRLQFCRTTQLGLLRLLTNQQVMGASVLNLGQAWDVYDRWMEDPRVKFAGETTGTDAAFRSTSQQFAFRSATKAIVDAYLVGFAITNKCAIVTFDQGLSQMAATAGISLVRPANP